jgi:hypothetical protein
MNSNRAAPASTLNTMARAALTGVLHFRRALDEFESSHESDHMTEVQLLQLFPFLLAIAVLI